VESDTGHGTVFALSFPMAGKKGNVQGREE